ncbi:TorF family putative porin [Sphingomonas flavalba]|uniref:TorF family putative porin n=1 Tax=Sphingomonas flavalba TaxID=2559804 RepID=UPI0039E0AB3C
MRTSILALTGPFLALAATPVAAQDTAPPPPLTISGSATLVSDYRFRGVSQTNKRFAVQGGLTVAHDSGLYASVWGSSIDDYVAAGSDQEIDLIAGYRTTRGGTTFDVGVLYYYYPGSGGAKTDFVEPYASVAHMIGPATAKLTVNYAPKAAALSIGGGKQDNLYVAGDLSVGIPTTPLSLSAHFGRSFGPSYLTIGKGYSDWNVGVAYSWQALTFGVSYVDASKAAYAPGGRNVARAGVVGSVGVSF